MLRCFALLAAAMMILEIYLEIRLISSPLIVDQEISVKKPLNTKLLKMMIQMPVVEQGVLL